MAYSRQKLLTINTHCSSTFWNRGFKLCRDEWFLFTGDSLYANLQSSRTEQRKTLLKYHRVKFF